MSDYTPGETIFTIGLNDKCKHIICAEKFVRDTPEGEIIIESTMGLQLMLPPNGVYKCREDAKAVIETLEREKK
jgi:hypothetical protein